VDNFLVPDGVTVNDHLVSGDNTRCYHPVLRVLGPFHSPQKYKNEDDLILMLELVPGHLPSGTIKVD